METPPSSPLPEDAPVKSVDKTEAAAKPKRKPKRKRKRGDSPEAHQERRAIRCKMLQIHQEETDALLEADNACLTKELFFLYHEEPNDLVAESIKKIEQTLVRRERIKSWSTAIREWERKKREIAVTDLTSD